MSFRMQAARLPLAWRRRLAVFVGGAAGGALRMVVSAVGNPGAGQVPWGTLATNVSGALALGYLLTRLLAASTRTSLSISLLCTGLLGSYTTFSAFSLETWELVEQGTPILAGGYALGSVAAGFLAAAAGIRLAEQHR